MGSVDVDRVFLRARAHWTSPTDIVRLIAAISGADPALQAQTVQRVVPVNDDTLARFPRKVVPGSVGTKTSRGASMAVSIKSPRFKVAKLSRPLRRALLGWLDERPADTLLEDMLRHRSLWVWLGTFLHPHEVQQRFPKVAHAFWMLREQDPAGTKAPPAITFNGRVQRALDAGDVPGALALLTPRPSSAAAPPAAVTSETVREMFEHAYVASRDTHGAHASR